MSSELDTVNSENFFSEKETTSMEDANLIDAIDEIDDLEVEGNEDGEFDLEGSKGVNSIQRDDTIISLYELYKDGDLNTKPDFQRRPVWDKKRGSKLIESILLNITIPMIYMAEDSGKINVIDGQQRLTAIFNFLDEKFSLTGLNVLKDLNKKKFTDLEKNQQLALKRYPIRTITFKSNTTSDLQFEIFTRLNTGAMPLNDQELRNCVYRGKFNELLKELASDKTYLKILGLSSEHKRMADVEYALRFFAFYENTYLKYKSPMKKFLNDTMEDLNDVCEKKANKVEEYKKVFKQAVNNVYTLLGENIGDNIKAANCFTRFYIDSNHESKWEKKRFNVSLFDILMWSLATIDQNKLTRNRDSIREAYINLMASNDEFNRSIQIGTSEPKVVTQRFEIWKKTLDSILNNDSTEPRAFSYELKQKLFDANPTCAICGQRISQIDDAAIDHVEQYWMGGRTIEENARLTHRYCNNARARKEAQENS